MKKLISAVLGLCFGSTKSAKKGNPVEWRFAAKKLGLNSFNIHMMAFIQGPWQLYSKQLNTVDGSLLNIEYDSNAFVIIMASFQEMGTPIEQYDLVLKEDMRSYRVAVNFVQTVKVIVHEPITIHGTIHYVIGDGITKLQTHKKQFKIILNE